MNESRELPGSPVVRTLCFPCWGPGSIPSRGTKIPRDTEHGPKKKNRQKDEWTQRHFPPNHKAIVSVIPLVLKKPNTEHRPGIRYGCIYSLSSLLFSIMCCSPGDLVVTGDVGLIPEWEDPLDEEMATHSCILAWKIPCTEKPNGLQSIGLQRVRHDYVLSPTDNSELKQKPLPSL